MLLSDKLIAVLNADEVASLYRLLPVSFVSTVDFIAAEQGAVVLAASQWPAMLGCALLARGDPDQHRDLKYNQKYLASAIHELAIVQAIARHGLDGLLVEPLPYVRWKRVERCIRYCERAERLYLTQADSRHGDHILSDWASVYRYTRMVLLSIDVVGGAKRPTRAAIM